MIWFINIMKWLSVSLVNIHNLIQSYRMQKYKYKTKKIEKNIFPCDEIA